MSQSQFQSDEKPLVVYGLMRRLDQDIISEQRFIVFNCIIPGALISMEGSVYAVHGMSNPHPEDGYKFTDRWVKLALRHGEQVHQLAQALEHTAGLPWLYIHRSGLVAKGDKHMEDYAPEIMQKMRGALEKVVGTQIQFEEVPEDNLWIPSLEAIDQAEEIGMLLPY